MRLLLWILVFVIGVTGWTYRSTPDPTSPTPTCAEAANTCVDSQWQPVSIGGVEGVIVPENEAADLVVWGVSDPIDGTWQPDEADIEELESHIEEAAAIGSSPSQQPRPESLDGYVRQYAGIIENGEQKIYVNGMCHVDGDSWKHAPYVVMDGGQCFFTAIYNVETEEFEVFRYNGDA